MIVPQFLSPTRKVVGIWGEGVSALPHASLCPESEAGSQGQPLWGPFAQILSLLLPLQYPPFHPLGQAGGPGAQGKHLPDPGLHPSTQISASGCDQARVSRRVSKPTRWLARHSSQERDQQSRGPGFVW